MLPMLPNQRRSPQDSDNWCLTATYKYANNSYYNLELMEVQEMTRYMQFDDTDYRQCAECQRWVDFAYPDINDGPYQEVHGKAFCSDACADASALGQAFDRYAESRS